MTPEQTANYFASLDDDSWFECEPRACECCNSVPATEDLIALAKAYLARDFHTVSQEHLKETLVRDAN